MRSRALKSITRFVPAATLLAAALTSPDFALGFQPAAIRADAPKPTVVPRPMAIERLDGVFRLVDGASIAVDPADAESMAIGRYLSDVLKAQTGLALTVREKAPAAGPAGAITLSLLADATTPDSAYELLVEPEGALIRAGTPRGLFHGVQTLRQLAPAGPGDSDVAGSSASAVLPCVSIKDGARFAWRGMLLDCGRHFMPKELVKRTIDLLAYHKMNVLHWHLTEDQGWRIEIKRYPKLTQVGAWRAATRESEQPRTEDGRYGGFYTQADIREIVAYAASRYVTIVPEIEMPGHCGAALAAYPELSCTGGPFEVSTRWGVHEDVYCAGNDATFEFLENVLSEVVELFDSPYLHVGGDEAPKARWKACPKCQARMKSEGLADEHELQSYFIRRIEKSLNAKNRRLIGWDEILEGGLAPNATVQSWRGMAGAVAAAKAGHDVIASPTSHCYLDYPEYKDEPDYPDWMGATSVEQAYSFEPLPAELSQAEAAHILGIECNLWTEHAPPRRVDWQAFPRLCALAEVAWSPPAQRDWAEFAGRLAVHCDRLAAMGVRYHPPRHSATMPVSREGEDWWKQRFAQSGERVRQGDVDVLFLGDSITQGWEGAGKAVWERHYGSRKAVNLGFFGDRTQHVLWRLDQGNLEGLTDPDANPKLAVIMIGTNNSNGTDHTAREIADGICAIVERLRVRLPRTKILLLAIFPRGPGPNPQRDKNAEANRLAALRTAEAPMVRYVDFGDRFLEPDGTLPEAIMPDRLHLSERGYEIWADAIEPLVAEMLGDGS